ncbi:Plug domain-containing protein [Bradyrhizobium manausense]|uniref:TonB-dependent receptor plug domain-containing protein n=1 Tax=Bradyrhizobium TaxID=374 RepID=UPI001BA8E198|nr:MULTISPECIES: Plug domain-containing protein [Bradyrhizobium]MBR0828952.1 Plug domain-containing protein [Bradyrhizobium manausense]UVO28042.1 Plug domain-containing protein [Bradyrhizobium arachidis]
MPANMLRTIAIVTVCLSTGAFAADSGRTRHAPVQKPATDRGSFADPAAPYKADRLSWTRKERPVNIPGQTTVLTRQVLDDMKATSLRDALRSTAGVTVGR